MNFEVFNIKQLQEFKTLLEITDKDLSVGELLPIVEREVRARIVAQTQPLTRIAERACPDCGERMIVKLADEKEKLVYYECGKCYKSVYEGKPLSEYQVEGI